MSENKTVDKSQLLINNPNSSSRTPNAPLNNDYGTINDTGNPLLNDQMVSLPKNDITHTPVSRQRSMSFSQVSVQSSSNNVLEDAGLPMSHRDITAPGGFRRSFIMRKHILENKKIPYLPNFMLTNFNDFLYLYGHYAGEDLSESDEDEEAIEDEEDYQDFARRPLLNNVSPSNNPLATGVSPTEIPHRIAKRKGDNNKKASTFKAILLLLKSFVGTGILFLPKGFSNGGYTFSTISLLVCSLLSYYCFILLISTKDQMKGINGYGDLGNHLYGKNMKLAILLSIVLSQIGFSAAYTVFVATNLKTLCQNLFSNNQHFSIVLFIIFQTLLFIPLSFTRNITKLTATALVADLFIFIGVIYIYYYPITYIIKNGIATETIVPFNNKNWSLFIGTAIFTFEGIGLLIPIQESMAKPHQFFISLTLVMVIVTVIFISVGLLCYCAFGSSVETVVLLNFPQDSPYTLTVQLLYCLAILLSTPLQLFPAIRILENWVFKKKGSGKYNPKIKWAKNYFRSLIVIGTTCIAWSGANDLDKFVSLVGSFACIPLIYIYPPLLHYKACKINGSANLVQNYLDIILILFGVILMSYTSFQTIQLWLS
ncbi:hypothetical protein TPHA_0B02530 [Tetrapisispora phaffii CBS 4417]|uniref:Amino acid transporter transmembrane domain-containing protein n=1 Tax=Tetrapisispora phaffii (strain ATCC 24235 / CBS 4417 / NBRC 1672 / NRRL Y-8282 / UCD 70-5) TaxID=1071381 RepID=G8BPJ5_TETPH|nr:hypothetical protein TPHA_0B02530 [Tetrapisispora phaffii CBS 4417]CCE61926.1 hypothetical protein TPHA_0B02530 [Tetrapisispora phaffii CBS 4417]